ncbi:MAG TPA: ribonuclease HII [Thermodesulfobacteriaceae bacterium]|nr:ribonuclease HII [Thermodesulfobacteriaceae bacterium]
MTSTDPFSGDLHPSYKDRVFHERRWWDTGIELVAGLDEVGRGCLAGPVVAAAVILPRGAGFEEARDSKTLSPRRRLALDRIIRAQALAVSIAWSGPEEIDRMNILNASLKAMAMAVDNLPVRPGTLLIDGNQQIPHPLPQETLIKGDLRSVSISCASIVAKVYRDQLMERMHELYPHYKFHRNKGYGTTEHRRALKRHGFCPIHRKTFRGVRELVG